MKQTVQKMMELIKSAISDVEITNNSFTLSEKELLNIYKISNNHDLSQLVWRALQKNKIEVSDKIAEKFKDKTYIAVSRYEQIMFETENLQNIFEKEKIPYMFLKGACIRKYYPEPWLRTSCDVDILIKKDMRNKIVALLDKNGYKKESFDIHNVLLIAPSDLHIELHFSIKENMKEADKILQRAWEYSNLTEDGKCMYHFDNEYFMFYLFAHAAAHFLSGGCGLKPFVDLYILEKNISYDSDKLNMLLEKGKIRVFADKMRELAYHWFENGELTDVTQKMEEYVLIGGAYGTDMNSKMVEIKKNKNPLHLLRRIFLPYEEIRTQYPIIDKHPILTPFCEIARIARIVFGGKLANKMSDAKDISENYADSKASVEEMINQLNL